MLSFTWRYALSAKLPNRAIVIPDGNPMVVSVDWLQANDVPSAPDTVRYQVFDFDSRAPTSPIVAVPAVSESMSFAVPPEYLPAVPTVSRKRYAVAIEAVFPLGGKHTEVVDVYVSRGFAFTG